MAEQTSHIPTVIADELHIVYRVNGAKTGKGSATAALSRIIKRGEERGVRKVHAVKGVSFTAYRGEAIGLIGSNGSGKSTLLAAIEKRSRAAMPEEYVRIGSVMKSPFSLMPEKSTISW